MELGVIFTTSFMVGFSGAMMPGPLLTVTIGETARRGFIAGPLIVLGHGILELILVIGLVAGLSIYLTQAAVFYWIAVIGGAFLIYMGYGMTRDAWTGKVSLSLHAKAAQDTELPMAADLMGSPSVNNMEVCENKTVDKKNESSIHPVMAGIFISVANPYFTIWWATIGLSYITLSLKSGTPGIASFFSGHIMADLVWYSLVAAAIAGGRKFLSDRLYKGILITCGIFLVGLGAYFLYIGILQ